MMGQEGDATPFTEVTVDNVSRQLSQLGYHSRGWETMYNGHTGRPLQVPAAPLTALCWKRSRADPEPCLCTPFASTHCDISSPGVSLTTLQYIKSGLQAVRGRVNLLHIAESACHHAPAPAQLRSTPGTNAMLCMCRP